MAQLRWVLRYLADIESDMSAIHRVDDIGAMPGRKFFTFAPRLSAYEGVIRQRALAELKEQQPSQPPGSPYSAPRPVPSSRALPVTREVLGDPAFKGIFSFGETGESCQPDLRQVAQKEYPELR